MSENTPGSGEAMERIAQLIYDYSSIRFSPARLANLSHRLRERQDALGLARMEDYVDVLRRDRSELNLLVDQVSTKETFFFRIPEQFQALREVVLPALERDMLDRVYASLTRGVIQWLPLRLWSAGCSTGPEPYSIVMALLSGLRHPRAWRMEIVATDLSHSALVEAQAGVYDRNLLREVPAEVRSQFFADRDGRFEVSPQVRKQVEFRLFNLRELIDRGAGLHGLTAVDGSRETRDLSGLDIIFCRNVMIYFDFAAQQALIDRLYDCLRPGGWLFTGDAELLHIYRHQFETVESFGTCVYRKPGGIN